MPTVFHILDIAVSFRENQGEVFKHGRDPYVDSDNINNIIEKEIRKHPKVKSVRTRTVIIIETEPVANIEEVITHDKLMKIRKKAIEKVTEQGKR